jgi:hypothetical protein
MRRNPPEKPRFRETRFFCLYQWFIVAGAPGFEPGITGPKPIALPLGYAPTRISERDRLAPPLYGRRAALLPVSGPRGNADRS